MDESVLNQILFLILPSNMAIKVLVITLNTVLNLAITHCAEATLNTCEDLELCLKMMN